MDTGNPGRGDRRLALTARVVVAAAAVTVLAAAAAIAVYFFRSSTFRPEPAQHRTSTTTSTAPPAPKDLEAAIAAAQEKADRHMSGDFAGEWLLFVKDLRDHITQEAFVEYSEVCFSELANGWLKAKAAGGRMDGPDRAIIRFELMGVIKAAVMAYEDGGWYKVPDEFLAANYGKSGAELITADRAQGGCQG
ncbi:hypothetical protein MM1218R_01453 [Mycobacterium marinum]|uniref:hypothetical protein n=1 Tax=Mycobacterium marinum TaxID=1781 RepID=UPI000E28AFC7|nr:hypothetical protein [Mycobacterium marinum]AXN43401.1 hypothetical protein MM1218R_01453 [Mycobacterium marinum]RFZ11546.1 hypothetical protein DE4381_01134 [Mycobacterium marinum]